MLTFIVVMLCVLIVFDALLLIVMIRIGRLLLLAMSRAITTHGDSNAEIEFTEESLAYETFDARERARMPEVRGNV